MLDFSMFQSGIDLKCPYSSPPLKPLNLKSLFLAVVVREIYLIGGR
jgi:hypothetical protein